MSDERVIRGSLAVLAIIIAVASLVLAITHHAHSQTVTMTQPPTTKPADLRVTESMMLNEIVAYRDAQAQVLNLNDKIGELEHDKGQLTDQIKKLQADLEQAKRDCKKDTTN